MGLWDYGRWGSRKYWHVWQVVEDTSKYAATPALGYAARMISVCVLIFLSLVAFVFWLGGPAEKSTLVAQGEARHVGRSTGDCGAGVGGARASYPRPEQEP